MSSLILLIWSITISTVANPPSDPFLEWHRSGSLFSPIGETLVVSLLSGQLDFDLKRKRKEVSNDWILSVIIYWENNDIANFMCYHSDCGQATCSPFFWKTH